MKDLEIGYAQRLKLVLGDPDRKPLRQMLCEILRLWVTNGSFPRHYYGNLLWKEYMTNIDDFVSYKDSAELVSHLNTPYWFPLLDNKLLFHLFFRDKPIPLPELLGYRVGGRTYSVGHQEPVSISSEADFCDLVTHLASTAADGSLFAKPVGGIGGRGCWRFPFGDAVNSQDAYEAYLASDYVLEEVVVQHPDMACLHSPSVNTIRIDTYRDEDGQVYPISGLVRMGIGGSCVDNATSGGCFCGVDLTTGRLRPYAYTLPKHGGARLRKHPDTGVVFEGYVIPCLQQAVQLAQKAGELVPDRLIGWDIAIAAEGPILIEGNPNYGPRMSQIAYGGYKSNPVYREMLQRERYPGKSPKSACSVLPRSET